MEEERREQQVQPNPMWRLLRVIIGVYLIYLAYKIVTEAHAVGDLKWYMILFSVIFILAGVILIVLSIKKFFEESRAERERAEAEAEQVRREEEQRIATAKANGETITEDMSITERLKALNKADGVEMEDPDELRG